MESVGYLELESLEKWRVGLVPRLGEIYGNKARYMARVGIFTNKVWIRVSIRKPSISSPVPYVHIFFSIYQWALKVGELYANFSYNFSNIGTAVRGPILVLINCANYMYAG